MANGLGGGFQHVLVELPLLKAEALGAFFPIGGFVAHKLVEREAGGIGAVVVKRSGASFPIVTRRKLAQAMKGITNRDGSFAEAARDGELEPGDEDLVVGRGLVRLEGPGVLRVESSEG